MLDFLIGKKSEHFFPFLMLGNIGGMHEKFAAVDFQPDGFFDGIFDLSADFFHQILSFMMNYVN
jgi:hypothetical protein